MAVIEDNIEDIEKQILDAVGYYEDTVPKALANLVDEITNELKGGNYQNRTGNLRRSIKVAVRNYSLSIKMANYGYYQSFGVTGTKKQSLGLPAEVAASFGVREGYKFKFGRIKHPGIKAKNFYPDDLEEKLLEILLNEE